MIQKYLDCLGYTLDNEVLREYIASDSFTKIKKESILATAQDKSFWVEGKKNGISLLFSIEVHNKSYPPIVADRKNSYRPYLIRVSFQRAKNKKTNYNFPFNLSFDLNLKKIINILGQPSSKSSEISDIWIRDDGSENFYSWHKALNSYKEVRVTSWNDDNGDYFVSEIAVSIKEETEIMCFYDVFTVKNFKEKLSGEEAHYYIHKLFLLEWLIKNNYYRITNENGKGISKLQNDSISIVDFVEEYLGKYYLSQEDILEIGTFVRQYVQNLTDTNFYYLGDYRKIFAHLTSDFKETEKKLNKVKLSNNNYKKVEILLNQRLKEFQESRFKKVEKL